MIIVALVADSVENGQSRARNQWNQQITSCTQTNLGAKLMSNTPENTVTDDDRITILPVGLEDGELRMLKSLCMISSIAKGNRNRKYALANPGEGSHIYLVDAKKADAYTRWRIANNVEEVPALLIADPGYESNSSDKVALRPLIPSRLLAMLDNLPVALAASA